MPVSSEIFSVDTLQIQPAEQAFRAGKLFMATSPSEVAPIVAEWSDMPLNWVMVAVCTISAILFLNRYIGLMPYIFGGLLRWKEISNLENSVRLTRDRNSIALIAFFIMALVVSRFGIYSPHFMSELPVTYRTIGVTGVLIAFLLLRECLIIFVSAYTYSIEQYRIANRAFYNFLIALASATVFLIVLMLIFDIGPEIVRTLVLILIVFYYLIFIIRKTQILAKAYGLVASILYLCSLELLPAGLLVASNYII